MAAMRNPGRINSFLDELAFRQLAAGKEASYPFERSQQDCLKRSKAFHAKLSVRP
jgi:hypothetical protein